MVLNEQFCSGHLIIPSGTVKSGPAGSVLGVDVKYGIQQKLVHLVCNNCAKQKTIHFRMSNPRQHPIPVMQPYCSFFHFQTPDVMRFFQIDPN